MQFDRLYYFWYDGDPKYLPSYVVPVRTFPWHPLTLGEPILVIRSLSDLLGSSSEMSNGTIEDGKITFWEFDPINQQLQKWASQSIQSSVAPGGTTKLSFAWPAGEKPSRDAIIRFGFEATLRVVGPNGTTEYPVYAFPPGTQSPEAPNQPPLIEMKVNSGVIDTVPLFGFASPGTMVGTIMVDVVYPMPPAKVTVSVDIKPGSCPNPLNIKSKGVLPVAILGRADFDISTLDPASIVLRREGVCCGVKPLRLNYEDVATPYDGDQCGCHALKGDGIPDLALKFDMKELVQTLELNADGTIKGKTIPLTITGKLKKEAGENSIQGEDCVRILK